MMPRWKDWAVILILFAACVFGAGWFAKLGTRTGNIESAAVIAGGTAILAVVTRRYSGFPRWASIASAAVLAASAIGGAVLWPDAASWRHLASGTLWMHPWYFLTLVGLGIRPRGSLCVTSQAAGWAIVTGATGIAVMLPLIELFL